MVFRVVFMLARSSILWTTAPGQGLTRTNLNVGVGTELLQLLDRLGPAHRPGQLADHEPADLDRILMDLRIGIEDLRPSQPPQRDLLPGGGEDLGRVSHQRRMEGPAYGQPHLALRPRGAQPWADGLQAGLAPRDHDLAGGIVVGDHDLSRAGGTGQFDGVVGQAEHRNHAAGGRGGVRHRPAASLHGRQRVEGVERLSRHQPGELAHAVAGDQRRGQPPGRHQAQQREAVKQDRRLRVAGRLELRLGSVEH